MGVIKYPGNNRTAHSYSLLPPAALPGAKLLKKFDQNFLLPFGQIFLPPEAVKQSSAGRSSR
jgi:hypothetical protein